MRGIVRWCLDRKSVVILGTIIILAAGAFGATQLRQQLFPDINFPILITTISTSGLGADAVDTQIAQPLAAAAKQSDKAGPVTTVSTAGSARMYVQFDFGTDTKQEARDLQDRVKSLQLPAGTGELKVEGGFNSQASVVASIAAPDGNLQKLQPRVLKLQQQLEDIPGVSRVELSGLSTPEYRILVTKQGLAQGITPAQVAAAVQGAQGVASAGSVAANGREVPVVVRGPGIKNIDQLKQVRIGGTALASVATVTHLENSDKGYARTDGKPSLSVSVFRVDKSNEVGVVDATTRKLDQLKREIGKQNVTIIVENATAVRASISGLLLEASLGALFAVIIIYLFLRSARGTLIAAVSIPTSIVFGLLVAWALGLTLDIITLAGLTIAIGRVIDDGIVVIENIHKHLERGEPRRQAVLEGTSDVVVAIAASTVATVAVFLPIGLVGGFISEIFLSFSIIVSVALMASFVVATTVIPVLASMLLRPSTTPHDPESGKLSRMVEPATRFGLRFQWIVIPVAVLVFIGTIGVVAFGGIPIQFLPGSGTQQVTGTVQLPPGTTATQAQKLMAPVETWAKDVKGSKDYQVAYGSAAIDQDRRGGPSTASFFLNLNTGVDADQVVTALRSKGEQQYPGSFKVMRISKGPPSGDFQANVTAPDQATLAAASAKIVAMLKTRKDTVEIASDAVQSQPSLDVQLKPGLPVSSLDVQGAIQGLSATVPAGMASDGSSISVAADPALLKDVGALSSIPVGSSFDGPAGVGGGLSANVVTSSSTNVTTNSATLGSVATTSIVNAPAFINRVDGKLSASVTATIVGNDTRGTVTSIQNAAKKLDLGAAKIDYNQGANQFVNQMLKDLGLAMVVAVMLVYLVLVVAFGSVVQPITILAPVLFSLIGSMLALVVTGNALGLPAMIGQLLLIGIVVSNSILLVDTAQRMRKKGVPRNEALLHAAKLRVRPVLMTASATIASLTPLALGVSGEGGIVSKSLGAVVIGGLSIATLLTLIIVPAVYTLFDRDHDLTLPHPDDRPAVPPAAPSKPQPVGVGTAKD